MTLYWLAQSGLPSAQAYLKETGFDKEFKPEYIPGYDFLSVPSTVGQEVRYAAVNDLIIKEGNRNILDLACGYSPRGLDMSEKGYRYHGGDLQMVIPQIEPIVKKLAGDHTDLVSYSIVDVTNKKSVMKAAQQLSGSVTVVTEGLMMYLNEFEQHSVCENIAAVLHRHGGCWIVPDFNPNEYNLEFSKLFIGEKAAEAVARTMKQFAQKGDSDLKKNMEIDISRIIDKFDSEGFEVNILPFGSEDLELYSDNMMDAEKQVKVRQLFHQGAIWKLTLKQDAIMSKSESFNSLQLENVQYDYEVENDTLMIKLKERLDSITAPFLIDEYEEISHEEDFSKVTFDMKDLKYISSAGIRILLNISKSLNSQIQLKNCNEYVFRILDQSSFFASF